MIFRVRPVAAAIDAFDIHRDVVAQSECSVFLQLYRIALNSALGLVLPGVVTAVPTPQPALVDFLVKN